MTFKLRYTLLAFLAFTAVIAPGVKLWYGPHHVVESPNSATEEEYTFTRDWRGNRVIQGVFIRRSWNCLSGEDQRTELSFFRDGLDTGNFLFVYAHPPASNRGSSSTYCGKTIPLTDKEKLELNSTRERERTRYKNLGLVTDLKQY